MRQGQPRSNLSPSSYPFNNAGQAQVASPSSPSLSSSSSPSPSFSRQRQAYSPSHDMSSYSSYGSSQSRTNFGNGSSENLAPVSSSSTYDRSPVSSPNSRGTVGNPLLTGPTSASYNRNSVASMASSYYQVSSFLPFILHPLRRVAESQGPRERLEGLTDSSLSPLHFVGTKKASTAESTTQTYRSGSVGTVSEKVSQTPKSIASLSFRVKPSPSSSISLADISLLSILPSSNEVHPPYRSLVLGSRWTRSGRLPSQP